MFTHSGISVDACVVIDGDCAMSFRTCGDQAEFEFGHNAGMLSIVTNEEALKKLVPTFVNALAKLQAGEDDEPGTG